MTDIIINIDPIEPLSDAEVKEVNLHFDKLVQKIAAHDMYFARVGIERARLEEELGAAENDVKLAEIKVKEAEIKARDIKTVLAKVAGYNDTAKSRVSLLKDIKKDFPKVTQQITPSAL
jgi:hypothetical protein